MSRLSIRLRRVRRYSSGNRIGRHRYKYDHRFTYDAATKKWSREIIEEHQKTFMQAHIYNSAHNIISNDMIASEEGVYTNVIVSYDGHTVGPMQADNDIRFDKQKTTMVEANIMGRFGTDGSWADIFAQELLHGRSPSASLRHVHCT